MEVGTAGGGRNDISDKESPPRMQSDSSTCTGMHFAPSQILLRDAVVTWRADGMHGLPDCKKGN